MDPFKQLFIRAVPKKHIKNKGSKAEVMHGVAIQTSKGLKKDDLTYNKNGSIVSKKKSIHGHRTYKKNK